MNNKIIISLFDFSGNWSLPYRDAGYNIIQIDEKLGTDIFDFNYKLIPVSIVHGILSAPPCTDFSKAGANYWERKDRSGQTAKSIRLVMKALEIIHYFNPHFWVMEQPPGRIEKLIRELTVKRLMSYQPYEFGAPYSKKTILYGNFNPFLVQSPVSPLPKVASGQMSIDNYYIHHLGNTVSRAKRSEFRAITPVEFARAFYQANP